MLKAIPNMDWLLEGMVNFIICRGSNVYLDLP